MYTVEMYIDQISPPFIVIHHPLTKWTLKKKAKSVTNEVIYMLFYLHIVPDDSSFIVSRFDREVLCVNAVRQLWVLSLITVNKCN